jgi:DNA-binding response OmpR family regulator
LEFSVRDSGIGIPPEQIAHIFDRFHRASEALTGEQGGTGIGLALTKEFVELHHGKIRVESESGKGSTFTVLLPLGRDHLSDDEIVEHVADEKLAEPSRQPLEPLHAEPAIESDEPSATAESGRPFVLIVEDNDDMRRYLRNSLNQVYDILEAENGASGHQTALEKAPDLIVSDVMMPGMNGFELCRKLKTDARTSHIPVILLTARAGQGDKLEGLEIGADDYLTKPFDARELQVRVKNLIEQRQRLRERFSREITVQPKDITVTSIDEKFLQQAIDIVEANMSDGDFQIDQFCRAIGMSRSTLNRKLRALTGLSTNVFIRTLRLKRAAQLLEKKSATIVEIAYEVGFNNPSYFAECFRQQFGRSPSEYTSN